MDNKMVYMLFNSIIKSKFDSLIQTGLVMVEKLFTLRDIKKATHKI